MSYSHVIASEDWDCLMLKGTDIWDLASKACQENSRNRAMLNMRSALPTIWGAQWHLFLFWIPVAPWEASWWLPLTSGLRAGNWHLKFNLSHASSMSLPKLFGCNPVDPFATCHTYSALLRRHQRGQRILGCDSCSLLHPWLPLKASTYYKQWPFRAESYNCCHHSSLCCHGQGKLKFLYFWSFQSFFRNILCVRPLFYSSIHLYLVNIGLGHRPYFS